MPDSIFGVAAPPAIELSAALDAIDRAGPFASRLRVAAATLHAWGFGRVMLVLRDASMAPQHVVFAGSRDPSAAPDALQPLPGVVWRQRLPLLLPFARDGWYVLPGHDEWVAREFWATEPAPRAVPGEWGTQDLIVSTLRGASGEVLGTALLAESDAHLRPDRDRALEAFALLRHLGGRVAHDALHELAEQRAERLQRLQEAGAALARSLDEREILRELARQVSRATHPDGVVIVAPDLAANQYHTLVRFVGNAERPAVPARTLGDGVIADVTRNGRPVRSGSVDPRIARSAQPEWSPLAALDVMGETVSEFGPPGSVLAVPVMVGIRLLGVLAIHASASGRFTHEDEELVSTMASQAATALANARRYAESERERRQTEALADVARAVGESLRPGEVLHLILRHSLALLQAEGACIALRHGDWLHIVAGTGAADLFAGVHVPTGSSLLGRVCLEGGLIVSNNLPKEDGAYSPLQRIAPIRNTVIAPLTTARGIIGAIAVINRVAPFTEDDGRILQRLGDQVSVAIVNARLFEEVEHATREWKVAFDAVATGLAVLDDSRRIVRCNKRLAELCGQTEISALLGVSFQKALLDDTVIAADDDVVARASREGTVARGDVRHARRGLTFTITASPHPHGGTMVTVDDITEAQRLAERHQRVLETAMDAIVITDGERRIAFANQAAHVLLSHTRTLVGTPVADLVAPESLEVVRRFETLAMLGSAQQYECLIVRADGSRRQVEVRTAPLQEAGEIIGTVACLRDITDQRAGASALERVEARYTRLVEEATDAIFTIDLRGNFTSVNRSLEEAGGVQREHLIGRRCVTIIDPRDREMGEDAIRRTLAGERLQLSVRYPSPEGRILIGSLISAPIFEDGVVVGALGIMRYVADEPLQLPS